jgi:putative restriction endonuclease
MIIEVRRDILAEEDGPMLRHGLQALEGGRVDTPRAANLRPNGAFLEERYELFRQAG